MSNDIPKELYSQIHDVMPIPCVDAIIVKDGSFLLVRRTNKPAQGKWWFPGGRIQKGELLADAVKRKMKEEIGLDVQIEKNLGHKETLFPDGPFGEATHTINIIFVCSLIDTEEEVFMDDQGDAYKWFSSIDHTWDPYVQDLLETAGFTE